MPRPSETDLNGARVVVTGAAGFIGAALTDYLVGTFGCEVVAIDNERSGDWDRLSSPVERLDHAIESFGVDDWANITRDVAFVFHLAAEKYNSSKSTPERVLEVNVEAFHRLLQGVNRSESNPKVVFTSSLYAYGSLGPESMRETDPLQPTTTYGASKAMGEYLLRVAERDFGLRWSVARLFFIYGPGQFAEGGYKSVILSNFERILRGESPTIYGDGRQALDYVFIQDCIDALVALASPAADGLVANVASGKAVSVNELTNAMLAVAGSEVAPTWGDADWTAGTIREGSAARMRDRLQWSTQTDLEVGLRFVWNWMSGGVRS